jgi:plastocyanin
MYKNFLRIGIIAVFFSVVPFFASAQVLTTEQAIQQLLQQLSALQAQLQQLQQGGSVAFCYTFNNNLRIGDGGIGAVHKEQEVKNLQTALEKEGFIIDRTEKIAGSVFGESTASAVVGFQEKYRNEILTSVGPSTRAKLNALYQCGNITPPTITTQTLTITTASPLSNGKVGDSYSQALNVSGIPSGFTTNNLNWSVGGSYTPQVNSGLPPGLFLTASDEGQKIIGTPTQAGTYYFSLTATTWALSQTYGTNFTTTTKQFTLTVNSGTIIPVSTLTITTSYLPNARVGQSYSTNFFATGGDGSYNWGLGADSVLPSGLSSIGSSSGVITGIPTATGTHTFTLTLISGSQAIAKSFTLTVDPAVITSTSNPTYSFSHNNGTLVAGQNAWTFTLSNAKAGDVLSVDMWKNGVSLGRTNVCTVQTVNSPIQYTSCSASAVPSLSDVGTWVENVLINGVQKGTINFSVVAPAVATQAASCSFSFSKSNILVGDTVSWTVVSNPTGLNAYWYGTKNGASDASGLFAGITNFTQNYTYQTGDTGSYTRYLEIRDSSGARVCTTNTTNVSVSSSTSLNTNQTKITASAIHSMMEALGGIQKQLDSLK